MKHFFYYDVTPTFVLAQAPTEFGEFKHLFLRLGATSSATADQYAAVLSCLFVRTGDERLHPNELRLAFKAVNGLFRTLMRVTVSQFTSV